MNLKRIQRLEYINEKTYKQVIQNSSQVQSVIFNSITKNNMFNIEYLKDKRNYPLYSRYNPDIEVDRIFEKIVKSDMEAPYFLFIGIGTGLQIKKALELFPNAHYVVIEPKVEFLVNYFEYNDVYQFNWKNCDDIVIEWEQIKDKSNLLSHFNNKLAQIILPTYKQIFKKEIDLLYEEIKSELKYTVKELKINSAFEKRWTINSIKNSTKVLKTSNFLKSAQLVLKNQPVILVSAGPSLTYDIDLIRKIKSEQRAYILAVGSASSALIEENIIPDLIFSYDPREGNQIITRKIKEHNLQIPLIFGSTIGYETINDYPGNMSHFITSQDLYGQYIFETTFDEIIQDAPSIAVVTLDILLRLNCYPIILAGQNLGFINSKRYAESVKFDNVSTEIMDINAQNIVKTVDVDGELMYTDENYKSMKLAMENRIQKYNLKNPVINTTKKGAVIKGTEYQSLEKVIEIYLSEKSKVSTEKLQMIFLNNENKEKIYSNNKKIIADLEKLKKYLINIERIIKKVLKMYNTRVFTNLNKVFVEFDKEFNRIVENLAYILFIVPMCRNKARFFVANKSRVVEIQQPMKKIEGFFEVYVSYFNSIQEAFNEVYSLIDDIEK